MTGFITDQSTAAAILEGIEATLSDHGQPNYWTTGAFEIHTGAHAGGMFIPAGDEVLSTPLRRGLTPMDFPETHSLLDLLGGLEARVEISAEELIDPEQSINP